MAAMVMTAKVSEVDYAKGFVKVVLTDRDNMVSDWISMLSHEYEMPDIGDIVTCDFTAEDCKTGFCMGRYYNDKAEPLKNGKNTYHKRFLKDADFEYDRAKKQMILTVDNLKIIAKKVEIKANIKIDGDLEIKGNLIVDGAIHANNLIESSVLVRSENFETETVPETVITEVVTP